MRSNSALAAGVAVGALISIAGAAFAQPATRARAAAAPAAAPAAPSIAHGPALPGVCLVSIEGALGDSLVGKAYNARLQQLGQQVNAELQPQAASLETDGRALETQRATLDGPTYQKRVADLNLRAANFDRLQQQRQREMQATQQKALQRIGAEVNQVLPGVYQEHHCSMLLRGEAVLMGNPAMDVTGAVTAALNAKITTITFDREQLPQQGGATTQ
jgi:outer membrane protein